MAEDWGGLLAALALLAVARQVARLDGPEQPRTWAFVLGAALTLAAFFTLIGWMAASTEGWEW